METKLSSSVAGLSDEQRKLLESLIGQALNPDEVVYWVVMRPGRIPTSADKAHARAGMDELFAKADRHAQELGITAEEFEAVVDEAAGHLSPTGRKVFP